LYRTGFRTSAFPKKSCALARQNPRIPLQSRQKILGTPFGRSAWVRIQNPLVRLRCVYFTKSEPVFKINNVSGDVTMNSVTGSASAPEHAGSVFLRFCRSRTALIPIASHSRFVCAGFLFSEWAIGLRAIDIGTDKQLPLINFGFTILA